jgi:hypothetical protein
MTARRTIRDAAVARASVGERLLTGDFMRRHGLLVRLLMVVSVLAGMVAGLGAPAAVAAASPAPSLLGVVGGAYAPWNFCNAPTAVTEAGDGTRYVAGRGGPACVGTVWKVTPWGSISPVTLDPNTVDQNAPRITLSSYGSWSGNIGSPNHRPADQTALEDPVALALDADGNLFIADEQARVVLEIYKDTGEMWLVAGVPDQEGCWDGTCRGVGGAWMVFGVPAEGDVADPLGDPESVAVDPTGDVFIVDSSNGLLEVPAATGLLTFVAGYPQDMVGNPTECGYAYQSNPYGLTPNGDGGPAADACISPASMGAVATDSAGNVYLDDEGDSCRNGEVHKINMTTGTMSKYIGDNNQIDANDQPACFDTFQPQDGAPASQPGQVSRFWTSLAFDSHNDLYLADSGYEDIRMVDPTTGDITTIAGLTADEVASNSWGDFWYGSPGFPALGAGIFPSSQSSCLAAGPDGTVSYCDSTLAEVYQPLAEQAYDPSTDNTLTAAFGSAGTATLTAPASDDSLTYAYPAAWLSLRQPPAPDPGLIPAGQTFVLALTYTHGTSTPSDPQTLTLTDPRITAGENVYEVDTPQAFDQAPVWSLLSDSSYTIDGQTVTIMTTGDPNDIDNEPRFVVTRAAAPPLLTVPTSAVTDTATSPGGADVDFQNQVSATTSDGATALPVDCTPTSGSPFPIGDTQVSCTVTDPASGLATTQPFTVEVDLPNGVSGQTSTGAAPTASVSNINATTTGTGTVGVWQYDSNPEAPTAPPAPVANYFDVYASGSGLTSVTVKDCNLGGGNTVYYWDAGTSSWIVVAPQSYDSSASPPCITFTLDTSTTPSITQLSGTPFAVVTTASSPTTLGAADKYKVLVLGGTANFSNDQISGDVAIGARAKVTNQAPSTINGDVYQSSSKSFSGPGKVTGKVYTDATATADATSAAMNASVAAAARPSNVGFGNITTNTTVTSDGRSLTVVSVAGNITLNNASLTLSGSADSAFIVNIAGSITLNGSGGIHVAGGLQPKNVLVNMTGSAKTISTHVGNVVQAKVLGPSVGGTLNGSFAGVLLGQDFSLMGGAKVA